MMDFNKGDKFIYYTKYGGVVRGVVDVAYTSMSVDMVNKCLIEIPHIRSTRGIVYTLEADRGPYKLIKEYKQEEIDAYNERLIHLSESKKKMHISAEESLRRNKFLT